MTEQANPHNQEPPHEFTQRFIDAVDSVRSYNTRHTGYGFALNSIVDAVMPDDPSRPSVSLKDEADMEKELVALLQTDELAEMGVALFDPQSSYSRRVEFGEDVDERQEIPSILAVMITDGDAFKDTLLRFNPTPDQKGMLAENVDLVLASTVAMIDSVGVVKREIGPDEEIAQEILKEIIGDQLSMFMQLNPTLVERGFGEGAFFSRLTEYAVRNSAGTLYDYLAADSKGWVSEGGYGPSRWVMDASPEYVRDRWSEIFDYLRGLRDREEPSPYFDEIFNKLRADFDVSSKWLEGDTDDENRKNYQDTYIEPLAAEMSELGKVWEKDFPLENGFYLSEAEANED